MSNSKSPGERLLKFLASVKLAVIIMVVLCAIIAIGTITESRYDAEAAKKLVYDTPWMYAVMSALAISLIAVMIDRWPWKRRHTAFVLAHIGILFLLFGGMLTMKYGLDGQMQVEIGRSTRYVVLPMETDILVYASFGDRMTKLYEETVDYFRHPPTEQSPTKITTDDGQIEIIDYKRYVVPSRKVEETKEASAGAGLRFQIQNPNVSVVEWLVQREPGKLANHNFGPAQIFLGPTPAAGKGANEIYLTPQANNKIAWTIFRRDNPKPFAHGITEEGGHVSTGWMGLELRVLRFYPHARDAWDFEERETPIAERTTPAIKVRFHGREQWILLNDTVRLFTEKAAYLVSYINRRIDLGFPVSLTQFQMIPYEGSSQAKEYKSRVDFPSRPGVEISMNEPAKYEGLTFYQASFQNNDQGQPTASVFSVNYDPGRWFKYLGSLIMTMGVVSLFWLRKVYWPDEAHKKETSK